MQITREDLNPCTVQLSISCEPEEVRQGFQRAVKHFAKQIRIPGFRPGQAPAKLIESRIHPSELHERAADEIIRAGYKKVLENEKLQPFAYPKISLESIDKDDLKCEYKMKVPLDPIVELGEYKGISVEKPVIGSLEEDLNSYMEALRNGRATRDVVTDRGAREQDTALIKIKPADEQYSEKSFMMVVGKTFAELDEILVGMPISVAKSAELKFPEYFQEKDWAGKTMKCDVALSALYVKKLPELNDEFAKHIGDRGILEQGLKSESLDELKEKVTLRINEINESKANEIVAEKLLEQIIQSSKIEIPDNTWEEVVDRRLWDIQSDARKNNQTLEEWAAANQLTVEQLKTELQQDAKEQVVRATAAKEIFVKEGLELSEELIVKALEQMASEFQIAPNVLFEELRKQNRLDEVRFRAIFQAAIDFLVKNAEIKNQEPANPKSKKQKS